MWTHLLNSQIPKEEDTPICSKRTFIVLKRPEEILGGLTESYLTKLYRVYQPDFIIFNYTIENFLAEVKKYSQTAF